MQTKKDTNYLLKTAICDKIILIVIYEYYREIAMKVLVIDAQGGGIGRQLVTGIKAALPTCEVIAVGTNSAATSAMLKAGADAAATGENAVIVNARKADVITGPIGIVIADSLYGEVTPKMAKAIGQADGKKVLIPINHCDNIIAGVPDLSVSRLTESALSIIKEIFWNN